MEVVVLNTDFVNIGLVDSFASIIWTDRYNSRGDFEMCLSLTSKIPTYLKADYYLWMKESEHLMIIENLSIDSDSENGNFLMVTGRSLESILERRIIWGQKILSGNLQTVIQTLITESITAPTIADRKISNFIFEVSTDPKITALTIEDTQCIGEDLYTVINKLCSTNDIGFKIVLNDNNQFVFSLYAGIDRSYGQDANPYIVFSPGFENIINSSYYISKANLRNVTLVAGEGEGSSRKTTIVGSGSGLNRRELFTDARDVSSKVDDVVLSDAQYTAQLQAKGKENLAEFIFLTAFEGQVEATRVFKYGEDFFIGDIVQIANGYGHEGRAYISELIMSQNEEGVSMYPTFQKIQDDEGGVA